MRERGLKLKKDYLTAIELRRSREGAWIEITQAVKRTGLIIVAPVRERGLKYLWSAVKIAEQSRSREGAWIEILSKTVCQKVGKSRSREGAWIEIRKTL